MTNTGYTINTKKKEKIEVAILAVLFKSKE